MENQRVNKITAVFNEEGGVTCTLYRTHTKLGTITNKDLNIPDFEASKAVNKTAYMVYCKETITNLLENGGVAGFYYDPKNESEQAKSGMPKKFDFKSFVEWSSNMVADTIRSLNEDVVFDIKAEDVVPSIDETYKDGNIKYASISIPVEINAHRGIVPVEIKSGQLCKPRKIAVDGEDKSLTATTIKSLMKSEEQVKSESEDTPEATGATQEPITEPESAQEQTKPIENPVKPVDISKKRNSKTTNTNSVNELMEQLKSNN